MSARSFFLNNLPKRADSRIDRAVLIASYLKLFEAKQSVTVNEICKIFEESHLAKPNQTVLSGKLTNDRRVSFRHGIAKALHSADDNLRELFPELFIGSSESELSKIDPQLLRSTPFIDDDYMKTLKDMSSFYEALHILENSIRRLIAEVLQRKHGSDWWSKSASASMQRKHSERLEKEATRKWLPTRSEAGPLYSVDWSDLITLIRKYEADFIPFIGEIDFIHRYSDLGLLRHVIAHNGFVSDLSEIQRVTLALRDWNKQVAPNVGRILK